MAIASAFARKMQTAFTTAHAPRTPSLAPTPFRTRHQPYKLTRLPPRFTWRAPEARPPQPESASALLAREGGVAHLARFPFEWCRGRAAGRGRRRQRAAAGRVGRPRCVVASCGDARRQGRRLGRCVGHGMAWSPGVQSTNAASARRQVTTHREQQPARGLTVTSENLTFTVHFSAALVPTAGTRSSMVSRGCRATPTTAWTLCDGWHGNARPSKLTTTAVARHTVQ